MSSEGIHPDARQFITEHITSVAQLEVLLLLRTNPQQTWSAEQLSSELRVEPSWISDQLHEFCNKGLLEMADCEQGSYRFSPRTPQLEKAVTAAAQAYLLHRVSVIELIYSQSTENLRAFSDAFKLRKEWPHG